jgi:acylphosphatase
MPAPAATGPVVTMSMDDMAGGDLSGDALSYDALGDDALGDDAFGDDAFGDDAFGDDAQGDKARSGAELTGGGEAPAADDAPARLTVWIAGHVQGVGLRWWIRARALELGLVGSAENLEDGRVKVVAEGQVARCRELLALLAGPGTPGRVSRVTQRWDQPRGGITGFTERL